MPRTLPITPEALKVNNLTDRFLDENGTDPYEVYKEFLEDLKQADVYVGHYAIFDKVFIAADCGRRIKKEDPESVKEITLELNKIKTVDTKLDYIHLNPRWKDRRHPGPYLNELCQFLGVFTPLQFHRADDDAEAMRLCMQQLKYQYSDTIRG